MQVTKWLKPSDSVSRYTVTARVCRPIAELEGPSFISHTVTHRLVDRRYSRHKTQRGHFGRSQTGQHRILALQRSCGDAMSAVAL
jgi:hypothetical protein